MRKKPVPTPPPTTVPCAVCGGSMKHVRTIPAAGFMAAMFTFQCVGCGCPRTEEQQVLGQEAEGTKAAA